MDTIKLSIQYYIIKKMDYRITNLKKYQKYQRDILYKKVLKDLLKNKYPISWIRYASSRYLNERYIKINYTKKIKVGQ